MAVIVLMENPKHGRMNVYSPAEVEEAKKHGWTVVVEEPAKVVEPEAVVEPEPAQVAKRSYNRREK